MGLCLPGKNLSDDEREALRQAYELKTIREAHERREAIDAVRSKTATPEQVQIVLAYTLERQQNEASAAAITRSLENRPNC